MNYITAGTGPYTLTHTWQVNGDPTDVGAVTIGITDANGDTVVSAGTATSNETGGVYTYSLADQTELNRLTVTWTRSDTGAAISEALEVIREALFTESDARAFDNAVMANTTTYTDAKIHAAMITIADLLEQWTGRGWIERYTRIRGAGTGTNALYLWECEREAADGSTVGGPGFDTYPGTVLRANDGGDITPTTIDTLRNGILMRTGGGKWRRPTSATPRNVTVEYTYGNRFLEADVQRIALLLLRERLVPQPTDFGGRATSFTNDLGRYQFTTPGIADNVSSIAEVNEWVRSHDVRSRLGV